MSPVFFLFKKMNLLLNTVQLLSTDSNISHYSFSADISSLVTFDKYSSFNSFILGFEIARPDGLVNILSFQFSQLSTARRHVMSTQILVVHRKN